MSRSNARSPASMFSVWYAGNCSRIFAIGHRRARAEQDHREIEQALAAIAADGGVFFLDLLRRFPSDRLDRLRRGLRDLLPLRLCSRHRAVLAQRACDRKPRVLAPGACPSRSTTRPCQLPRSRKFVIRSSASRSRRSSSTSVPATPRSPTTLRLTERPCAVHRARRCLDLGVGGDHNLPRRAVRHGQEAVARGRAAPWRGHEVGRVVERDRRRGDVGAAARATGFRRSRRTRRRTPRRRPNLGKMVGILDAALAGKQFLLGNDYSLVDAHLLSVIDWMRHTDRLLHARERDRVGRALPRAACRQEADGPQNSNACRGRRCRRGPGRFRP